MKTLRYISASLVLLSSLYGNAQVVTPARVADEPVDTIEAAVEEGLTRDQVLAVVAEAENGNAAAINQLGVWYYTGEGLEQNFDLAAKMWARAAEMGNNQAVGNLGICYQYGHGVEADSVRAMQLYSVSLRKGNPELFANLLAEADRKSTFECAAVAYFYNNGIGCSRNFALAGKYYSYLAAKGDIIATRSAGVAYLNAKEYRDALKWLKKGADQHDTVSEYYYGQMLVNGMGITPDPSKGFVYALRAAEKDLANAQYFVSTLYRNGNGVEKSESEANRWLRTAAFQGLNRAMFDYAVVAARQDNFIDAAYMLSWLTARNSYMQQMTDLFTSSDTSNLVGTNFHNYILALRAINAGDEKAFKSAVKALKNCAAANVDLLNVMMTLSPANPKRDIAKGLKELTKLSDKGNVEATFQLARLYERGTDGIAPDYAKSIELYKKAIEGEHILAWINLGNFAYEGLGETKDINAAVTFYTNALDAGYMFADAANRFQDCIEQGAIHDPFLIPNHAPYATALWDFLKIVP